MTGFAMAARFAYILVSFLAVVYIFSRIERISYNGIPILKLKNRESVYFDTWHSCAKQLFFNSSDDAKQFWDTFAKRSQKCDEVADIRHSMKVVELENTDEKKYAILPVARDSENVFVTLGIGQDISAEEAFRKKMHNIGQSVTFFGADPIADGNSKLFSTLGQFFPFAVGAKAGFSVASVLVDGSYQNVSVAHVDLYYFLKDVLKKNYYDYLWMDTEYAEYDTLDMFYKNGPLSKTGITFCQMSLEVHRADTNQQEMFWKFVKTLIDEKQFGFFFGENVGHNRLWLFNFGSDYCVRKFL